MVSEYLGHSSPAVKLRVYAHVMLGRRERTRMAIATACDQFPQPGLTARR
ncbi:hypothetical protein OG323_10905 [Streptomyces cyaneofuscatus]|nr:hypothetical protein OG323_10905 [Streptomyces cyaneofuscatus]